MNTQLGTTTVQEVINVPIMISPEMYNQLADLVLQRIENNTTFNNIINAKIDAWMDRNFDISDYNTENIRNEILDEVRYDLKQSIRAEVEIFVD
jgi:spore germination protein YaaH